MKLSDFGIASRGRWINLTQRDKVPIHDEKVLVSFRHEKTNNDQHCESLTKYCIHTVKDDVVVPTAPKETFIHRTHNGTIKKTTAGTPQPVSSCRELGKEINKSASISCQLRTYNAPRCSETQIEKTLLYPQVAKRLCNVDKRELHILLISRIAKNYNLIFGNYPPIK
ncbi:hypothetical protein KIN20_031912 [Parelaphostrongylus tenuis]|uniref:Uncharacterized protein n=1 Tax=Parelaphostrongylus tenuis TaxID=148309 RepID=A0AAD5WI32_PARTN|nr:hypothetical protein KIN20_031912 [Parelaphostrongylus tenuis]